MANNPLMSGVIPTRHDAGSAGAGDQLFEHCARLNRMRGDRHWYVIGEAPNRRIESGARAEEDRRWEPRCNPSEAKAIMRQSGLGL